MSSSAVLATGALTFAITGRQKGRDEGATLLPVRVHGVVSLYTMHGLRPRNPWRTPHEGSYAERRPLGFLEANQGPVEVLPVSPDLLDIRAHKRNQHTYDGHDLLGHGVTIQRKASCGVPGCIFPPFLFSLCGDGGFTRPELCSPCPRFLLDMLCSPGPIRRSSAQMSPQLPSKH